MYAENALETTAKVGSFQRARGNLVEDVVFEGAVMCQKRLSELIPSFLKYGQFELSFSPNTVSKYQECLKIIVRDYGDMAVGDLNQLFFTDLKAKILMRGAGEARVASMVFALKSFLKFCREYLELNVLDYKKIKSPKRRRREVIYLTNEEIEKFIDGIKIERRWKGNRREKGVRMDGLRFRTLVEVLLGTGMRISEALSVNKDDIDFEKKEAKIIGKGSKERTVFFSDRSLDWVKYYLSCRKDESPALFVTQLGTRLSKMDINKVFARQKKIAGINKKITPHILRHTMATNLLFNGCPISHVKEILGHDRLETTCRYYLGLDKSKAKEAHSKFLDFKVEGNAEI